MKGFHKLDTFYLVLINSIIFLQELQCLSIISGLIYNLSIIYEFDWNTALICWLILLLFPPCPTIVKYSSDAQCIKPGSLSNYVFSSSSKKL